MRDARCGNDAGSGGRPGKAQQLRRDTDGAPGSEQRQTHLVRRRVRRDREHARAGAREGRAVRTSAAARLTASAASVNGTTAGRAARAAFVSDGKGGTAMRNSSCGETVSPV